MGKPVESTPQITDQQRDRVEAVLKKHGVHWNGKVEPHPLMVDELIAAACPIRRVRLRR